MRNCISWDFGEGCDRGTAFIINNLINTSTDTPAWDIFACGLWRQMEAKFPPALLGTSCPSWAEQEKPKLFRSSSMVDLECTNLICLEGREGGSGYTCELYIPVLTACRSCARQEIWLTTLQGSFQVIKVVAATKEERQNNVYSFKKEKQQVLTFWEGIILFNCCLYPFIK